VVAERGSEGLVQVTHRHGDAVLPALGPLSEPSVQVRGLAALDQVDDTAGLDCRRCSIPSGSPRWPWRPGTRSRRPDGRRGADPLGVLDQRLSPQGDGVHDRVPGHAQLLDRPRHRVHVATDLERGPHPGPLGHGGPGRGDVGAVLGPGAGSAVGVATAPAALEPHQRDRGSEGGKVGQLDAVPVLDARPGPTGPTTHEAIARLDGHDETTALSGHVEDLDSLQADEKLAPARTVRSHRGSPPGPGR
jgi:hypothetical protein